MKEDEKNLQVTFPAAEARSAGEEHKTPLSRFSKKKSLGSFGVKGLGGKKEGYSQLNKRKARPPLSPRTRPNRGFMAPSRPCLEHDAL